MKDAYYFPHDSNAKDDPKCIMLIEELGLEGYGIFWMLLETLRDQPGYRAPVNMIPGLARRYNSTAEKVKAVVIRYELFEIDEDEFFFSLSFKRRMEVIDEKRQKRSIAGQKGNEVRWGSQSDRNAIASKGKESIVKESKEKKPKNGVSGKVKFKPPESLSSKSGFLDVWKEWEAHRAAIGKKMTEHAAVRIFNKLEKSSDPIEVLNKSIENGWTGIFPDENNSQESPPPGFPRK